MVAAAFASGCPSWNISSPSTTLDPQAVSGFFFMWRKVRVMGFFPLVLAGWLGFWEESPSSLF